MSSSNISPNSGAVVSSSGGKHVSFTLFVAYLCCAVFVVASPKQFVLLFELRVIGDRDDADEDADEIGDAGDKLKSVVSSGSSLRTTREE